FSNVLIIAGPEVDANFGLAARNIPHVDVLPNAGLNVYDVLRRQKLVLTKAAVEALEARFAADGKAPQKEAARWPPPKPSPRPRSVTTTPSSRRRSPRRRPCPRGSTR